jgi:conjugative transposon TraM protein
MSTTIQHSPAFLKKRRFYVALPILVIPFITLLFWVLGGGSGSQALAQPAHTVGGLNLQLPAAKLKDDSHWTKLDYYKKADQDSAKRLTQIRNDPYYRLPSLPISASDSAASVLLHRHQETKYLPPAGRSVFSPPGGSSMGAPSAYSDPNEAKVYQKLATLNTVLNQKTTLPPAPEKVPSARVPSSPDVERLEHLMQVLHTKDTTTDPEMQQLSGMLDKIMAIQHPENVPASVKNSGSNHKGQVYAVQAPEGDNISLLGASSPARPVSGQAEPGADSLEREPVGRNAFYSLDDNTPATAPPNTIDAVVHETVTIVNGSTVQFRLTQDVRINGILVPEGSFAFGAAQFGGDRLTVSIKSIQYQRQILPVSLSVYGLDGLPGIPVPGSVTRDVAKQSADQSISSVGLTSLDQSLGAQAATAGIQTVKNLVSKKVRLVHVTLPAGFQVLLKDNNQK